MKLKVTSVLFSSDWTDPFYYYDHLNCKESYCKLGRRHSSRLWLTTTNGSWGGGCVWSRVYRLSASGRMVGRGWRLQLWQWERGQRTGDSDETLTAPGTLRQTDNKQVDHHIPRPCQVSDKLVQNDVTFVAFKLRSIDTRKSLIIFIVPSRVRTRDHGRREEHSLPGCRGDGQRRGWRGAVVDEVCSQGSGHPLCCR